MISLLRSAGCSLVICCASAAAGACASEQSSTESSQIQGQQKPDLVQWLFLPTTEERHSLDSLLRHVDARYSRTDVPLRGQIDTLPATQTAGVNRRYLYIGPFASSTGSAESVKLFVLTRESVSEASPMSIVDHPNRFAVTATRDLDADGLADIAYCTWTGLPGTQGTASAVGYRDGGWYFITGTTLPECGLLPSP